MKNVLVGIQSYLENSVSHGERLCLLQFLEVGVPSLQQLLRHHYTRLCAKAGGLGWNPASLKTQNFRSLFTVGRKQRKRGSHRKGRGG